MSSTNFNSSIAIAVVLFLFAEVALLFFTPRTETAPMLVLYGALFGASLFLYQTIKSIRTAAFLAVLFRLIAWIAFPALSDDIYRFIWDGNLVLEGISPYLETPTAFFADNVRVPYDALYPKLNSSGYFSVYPPVIQLVSAFGALVGNDVYLASLVIKLPLFIAEIATIWTLPLLLLKLKISPKYSVLYMLNPLIIVDVLANAHFEILVVLFILLTLWNLRQDKFGYAALSMALAVGTKLLPLLILPFLVKAIKPIFRKRFILLFSLATLIIFAPFFWPENLIGLINSVTLYYDRFEFNASVYYVLRAVGSWVVGYNPIAIIGPMLGVLQLIGLALIWTKQESGDLTAAIRAMLAALTMYFFLATTVHPWYIAPLILLGIVSRTLYPLVWSAMIFLTYSAYRSNVTEELWWVNVLAYGLVVAAMIFPGEIRKLVVRPLRQI